MANPEAIADLILRSGEIQAAGKRNRGTLIGSTLASLGQVLPAIQQRQAHRQQQEQQAIDLQQQREMRDLEIQQRRKNLSATEAGPDPLEQEKKRLELASRKIGLVAQTLQSANANTYAGARARALAVVGKDMAEYLPETYQGDEWRDSLVREGLTVKEQIDLKRQEMEAAKPPAPVQVQTVKDGKNVTEFVTPKAGATFENQPKVEPRETNPTEASLALAAANGDEDAKLALALLRGQRASAGGVGGGALTTQQKRLVDAVMAEPSIYNTLIPSVKTEIAAELQSRGFKGFSDGSGGKPATGAQNKVLGFFNRAKQASEDLQNIEEQIGDRSFAAQSWDAIMPGFMQTDIGRQYEQSQRAFTEARLRKDSGAAIPPQEFANDRKTYFVQPGDDQKTIDNKRRARNALLASLAFESGPALGGFYGEEADGMIEAYRAAAKAAGGTSDGPKEGETKPIPGYPGTEQTYRGGKWIRTK